MCHTEENPPKYMILSESWQNQDFPGVNKSLLLIQKILLRQAIRDNNRDNAATLMG
jgi:hypothetical protein